MFQLAAKSVHPFLKYCIHKFDLFQPPVTLTFDFLTHKVDHFMLLPRRPLLSVWKIALAVWSHEDHVITSFVLSRIDYCNSLLIILPTSNWFICFQSNAFTSLVITIIINHLPDMHFKNFIIVIIIHPDAKHQSCVPFQIIPNRCYLSHYTTLQVISVGITGIITSLSWHYRYYYFSIPAIITVSALQVLLLLCPGTTGIITSLSWHYR